LLSPSPQAASSDTNATQKYPRTFLIATQVMGMAVLHRGRRAPLLKYSLIDIGINYAVRRMRLTDCQQAKPPAASRQETDKQTEPAALLQLPAARDTAPDVAKPPMAAVHRPLCQRNLANDVAVVDTSVDNA
jgi:hypothetical protein